MKPVRSHVSMALQALFGLEETSQVLLADEEGGTEVGVRAKKLGLVLKVWRVISPSGGDGVIEVADDELDP